MTPLDKPLKRAVKIKQRDYVVTLAPDSIKIAEKGHRLGVELKWIDIISGDSALAVALHASLGKFPPQPAESSGGNRRATGKRKAPKRSR